jgi:enoyl-CoA hydratase/carnithine racemase
MEPFERVSDSTADVLFEVQGAVALIVLNRGEALNALTHAMCLDIDSKLRAWATDPEIAAVVIRSAGDRAFCAGGDVRALYDSGVALKRGRTEGHVAQDFIRDEYRMNRRIKTYRKPYIALIDGLVMGGGFGVSVHGSYRIATERTQFAMPETAIGLFPDVGASFVLPRLPGEVGAYLGLTGARIKAPDLIALGLATHFVPSSQVGRLLGDLIGANWNGNAHDVADVIVRSHSAHPGDAALSQHLDRIERCFLHDDMSVILQELDRMECSIMTEAAAKMRILSPTSLKLTLAANRRGRQLEFDDCLVMEYRLIQSILLHNDFYEGVRAVLIDKDRKPIWQPSTLDAVDEAMLERYFVAPPPGDLTFAD